MRGDDKLNKLALQAKTGQEDYEELLRELKPMIDKYTRRYWVPGYDKDDIRQEIRYAIWMSVRAYELPTPFAYYARLRIKSHLITLIKKSRRLNRIVHLHSSSLDNPLTEEGREITLADLIGYEYEDELIVRESRRIFWSYIMELLSDNELHCAILYHVGRRSYKNIEESLNLPNKKSVDNALQRARKKLRRHEQKLREIIL